jgi:hypothetical protein
VADSCTGFRIADVETTVDKIVFCGGDDNEGFVCIPPYGRLSDVLGK